MTYLSYDVPSTANLSQRVAKCEDRMFRAAHPITLLGNHVLVRLIAPERFTGKAKLWIPETAHRQPYELYRGVVIAHGPGARSAKNGKLTPCDVEPGDEILFYWLGGVVDVTKWPSDEYRIIKEEHIQAVIG